MPVAASPRRRSRDDVENEEEERDSSAAATSARDSMSSKRIRLSTETDASSPINGNALTNGNHVPSNGLQSETLRARSSKRIHQPGSIVRVKLSNFVTYTAVEFLPGPSLNMVIGPNGTGKSTLVCAICLGLGWGPQHLGRAKDVSEFVKHGTQEATIEIELAKDGKRFKENIVIRCTIKREGNKTAFSVDGKPLGKKAVVELARSLSIQIDNLCQFLPQDKVVEFAAMTPIELLRSTQRAVASQEMIDVHEELKDYRRKEKDLQARVTTDQETLNNFEGRQRLQEADVERMREREEVVKRVELLEAARPFAAYRAAKVQHREAKEKSKAAQDELTDLRTEQEPSLRAVNAKQQYKEQVDTVVKERKGEIAKAETIADKADREFNLLYDRSKELEQAKEAERSGVKTHKTEIARLQQAIGRLQKQLEEPPAELDAAAYNEKIREKQRGLDNCERSVRELQRQQTEIANRGKDKKRGIADAERSLNELESQSGKQNLKLERASKDTSTAWKWIQENQAEFEKPILGPPMVVCSVSDPRYVDLIEALIQRNVLLSFTAQTRNDFKKLSNIAHDKLNLAEINIKTMEAGLDVFRPPGGPEAMKQFGFEGWALDYLQGPEPVLAMLCADSKIHETGVSMRDTTSQQFNMLQDSSIQTWVTRKSVYRISRRREYGPGATSTTVKDTRRAQVWTDQPVDLTAKRELQERIRDLEEEVKSFGEEISGMNTRIHGHRETYRSEANEKKALEQEKATKQQAIAEFKGLPAKLAAQKAKRALAEEHLAGVHERVNDICTQQDFTAMDRARVALEYANSVEALRIAHNGLHEAEIILIEATSDFSTLQERNRSVKELLEGKEKEVEALRLETQKCNQDAKAALERAQAILLGDSTDTIKAFVATLPTDQTPAELETEIESEKARLELMHEGNGGVIKEFETRKNKIDNLSVKLEQFKTALAELDATIAALRNRWEPELDRLVGRISESFSFNMEQISCAGEVGIHKDDDFDQWAIQIRVKFRESEPLTPLDSHRQSGGERAVSTIFYLMSLQSLTKSPFRVVDEINQGMDPRNERLVHKRMVGIACGNASLTGSEDNDVNEEEEGGSQYFLITPKLLHDLEYARGMQVLCIASGEYMPEDRERVDFRGCIEKMRGLKGGGLGMGMDGAMDGGGRVGIAAG